MFQKDAKNKESLKNYIFFTFKIKLYHAFLSRHILKNDLIV